MGRECPGDPMQLLDPATPEGRLNLPIMQTTKFSFFTWANLSWTYLTKYRDSPHNTPCFVCFSALPDLPVIDSNKDFSSIKIRR